MMREYSVLYELILSVALAVEEGWGGRNRRCKSSILNQTCDVAEGVLILQNGNSIASTKGNASVQNTCAFDSLAQICACFYTDLPLYKDQIDSLPNNLFGQLVSQMSSNLSRSAKAGRMKQLYSMRCNILQTSGETSGQTIQFKNSLTVTDSIGNINYTIERSIPTILYSYVRSKRCKSCKDVVKLERAFIDLDLDQLRKQGISNLDKCILMELRNKTRPTRNVGKCLKCSGILEVISTQFNNIVMFDTQTCFNAMNESIEISPCRLADIPQNIAILNNNFRFVAAIEFRGSYNVRRPENLIPGHYVCHVKRKNNEFETYDDLNHSKTNAPKSAVNVSALFYAKK